jgi:hypothetical protein
LFLIAAFLFDFGGVVKPSPFSLVDEFKEYFGGLLFGQKSIIRHRVEIHEIIVYSR